MVGTMGLAVAWLGLILLLPEARENLEGAHSLCFNLTVRAQTSPGQPWCEAQGSVDGKPFLQYDSDSSKATPLSLLGEKVKDTKAWRDLFSKLPEVGKELRMTVSIIQMNSGTTDPPSLQVMLCCQREAGQLTGATCELHIREHRALMDTKDKKWKTVDSGAGSLKEEWESHQDLAEDIRKLSTGVCNQWLGEFLPHWEEMLEPTVPPSETPGTLQSSSSTQSITRMNPVISICSVLMSIWLQL